MTLSYHTIVFDQVGIEKLEMGVRESLKSSDETVKANGGYIYLFFKRFFDIILSLWSIIVLAPLMIIISILIYVDDKGSPIFSQVRFTKNGKPFKMYKFRSMCMDAEEKIKDLVKHNEQDGLAFKMKCDPRITKIGRFIRKTSIDELPQLFNILMGDMTIVGPRPPLPREVVGYTPYQMNRLLVKGGLTCFWQCSGRSKLTFEDWVNMDIEYIRQQNLWVDAKIILKTAVAVCRMDGAA